MVHRLLAQHLNKGKWPSIDLIEEASAHSSKREQLATKANEILSSLCKSNSWKIILVKNSTGDFWGNRSWYLCGIIENKCEGMVRIKDVQGLFFFDERNHFNWRKNKENLSARGSCKVTVTQKPTGLNDI